MRAVTPARAALARLMAMAPASRSRPWKRKGVGCGWAAALRADQAAGSKVREALEGEGAGAAGGEAGGDLGGLEDEGAGAAHRVEDRLGAGVAAGAQEEGGEGLAQRGGADLLLVAAAVERRAGGVEADGAEVVVDADLEGHGVAGVSARSSGTGAPRVSAIAVAMRWRAAPAW